MLENGVEKDENGVEMDGNIEKLEIWGECPSTKWFASLIRVSCVCLGENKLSNFNIT